MNAVEHTPLNSEQVVPNLKTFLPDFVVGRATQGDQGIERAAFPHFLEATRPLWKPRVKLRVRSLLNDDSNGVGEFVEDAVDPLSQTAVWSTNSTNSPSLPPLESAVFPRHSLLSAFMD